MTNRCCLFRGWNEKKIGNFFWWRESLKCKTFKKNIVKNYTSHSFCWQFKRDSDWRLNIYFLTNMQTRSISKVLTNQNHCLVFSFLAQRSIIVRLFVCLNTHFLHLIVFKLWKSKKSSTVLINKNATYRLNM